MIAIRVAFDRRGFDGLARKIPLAIARGLNEGGDKVRTEVKRALWRQTGVRQYKSINSRTADSGKGFARAAPGRLAYRIIATGKGIPIAEFPVTNTGHGIDAKTWGVDHLFKRSFEIKGMGVAGFRARTTDKRIPIRAFYGPSLPKELVKGEAASTFHAASALHAPPAILKHLAKAFG